MNDVRTARPEGGSESMGNRTPYAAPALRVVTEEEILAQLGPGQLYTGALPFEF